MLMILTRVAGFRVALFLPNGFSGKALGSSAFLAFLAVPAAAAGSDGLNLLLLATDDVTESLDIDASDLDLRK